MRQEQQWKLMDQYKRKNFIYYELKNLLLQSFTKNKNMPFTIQSLASYKKSLLPRTFKITQFNNRCLVSGRNKNVLKRSKLSRFAFRRLSYLGQLPGVSRSSR